MRSVTFRLMALVATLVTGFAQLLGASAPSVPRSDLQWVFPNRAQHRKFDSIVGGHRFADAQIAEIAHAARAVGATMGTDFVLATQDATRRYEHLYNVSRFGARGNGKAVNDAAITSGAAILTSTLANFTAADVGAAIYVDGAGAAGSLLSTTILSRQSATQVTLAANASTTIASGGVASWGTDDYTAIQAAITAAIATGGRVHCPEGAYLIRGGRLDFSALKGTAKEVWFTGAGAGSGQPNQAYIPGTFGGTTALLNATGGRLINAEGVQSTQPIVGLHLMRFAVQNEVAMGSAFTVWLDLVTERHQMADVYVDANGRGGNGIGFNNFPLGQSMWERVISEGFNSTGPNGVCLQISNETTAGVPSSINCGNSTFIACAARSARIGWYIHSGNTLNGMTFSSCKAVNVGTDPSGATTYGFYCNGAGVSQNTFLSPHSENFWTGFELLNANHNTLISPLASWSRGGSVPAGSAGIRMNGTAYGNTVLGARVSQLHYGVSFEDNTQSNYASGDDFSGARVITAFFNDTSAAKTNITTKIEDGTTTPVMSLAGHSVLVDGFEAAGPELAKLNSGEATLPRTLANLGNVATMSSGVLRLTFFTARKTETITQLRLSTGTTAAGATPTLVRAGIYSVDAAGAGTLVASIANDTTIFAATNTEYLRSLTASFSKVKGQRYALGILVVTAAAAPLLGGAQIMGAGGAAGANAAARGPRISGALTGQADLPGSFTDAGLTATGNMIYAELVP